MASCLSHNNVPLATLLQWYKIRDIFFGENHRVFQADIDLALELASSCEHPDALWLTEACAGKDVSTAEDAKRVFSALGQNDGRALCFTWLCGERNNLASLRRSAELGFAFAQSSLAGQTKGKERFKFAQLAGSQGERDGLFWLGRCYRVGVGCEKDLDKAKENYLRASELGDVSAMIELGEVLDSADPERWRWWGQAAARGDWSSTFSKAFAKQVELFKSGSGSSAVVVFAIGQKLHGRVDEVARTIFESNWDFDLRIGPAKQAITFYEAQIKATKDAMRAWTLVGVHYGVVKDVRKLIAKLIWDSREEALYKFGMFDTSLL
jgi:hypothetical protein